MIMTYCDETNEAVKNLIKQSKNLVKQNADGNLRNSDIMALEDALNTLENISHPPAPQDTLMKENSTMKDRIWW